MRREQEDEGGESLHPLSREVKGYVLVGNNSQHSQS